jgi:6-phosphofructokinase 1
VTVLGYVQRGGTPSATDRIIATRYGTATLELILKREFGKMVALKDDHMTTIDLENVSGKLNLVTSDHKLVKSARSIGTCFGDKIKNN